MKEIDIDMEASEFIGLFKRFNVTLSFKDHLMEGVEYYVK
ncbi:hypothetical protein MNB_SUP05-SYMBIONT-5-1212 [hydrothermal vent metagenome]|uniref:Uncharacterized protein n=1 Tax=hydrothermal vent metagenome TaxID=652676 RepID=A0A1W1E5B5_9ZZZZ